MLSMVIPEYMKYYLGGSLPENGDPVIGWNNVRE